MADVEKSSDGAQPLMTPKSINDGAAYDGADVLVKQPAEADFAGLTKEELEQYAKDPFWRAVRLILFILFWLAWIAMFVAAIAIVILSPKCPEKPIRHWWQKQVSYQIFTKTFKDTDGDGVGDIKGIESGLSALKRISVQSLWLSGPVMQQADNKWSGYDTTNFHAVDKSIGGKSGKGDMEELKKSLKSKEMYMMMDFMPSVMSNQHDFFADKSQRDNYCFVADEAGGNADEWTADTDGKFYRHWPGRPDRPLLDMSKQEVMKEQLSAMDTWLRIGMDGFYIFSRFLAFNDNGQDWDETAVVLKKIRDGLTKLTNTSDHVAKDKEILLFTSVDPSWKEGDGQVYSASELEDLKTKLTNNKAINYIVNGELSRINQETVGKDGLATSLRSTLKSILEMHKEYNETTWPMWEMSNPTVSRPATRYGSEANAELFQLLLLSLPGSINTYYGDEIGMLDIKADSIQANDGFDGKPEHYVMRSPMQWDDEKNAGFSTSDDLTIPVHPNYTHINYKTEYADSTSAARLYKRVSNLRQRDDTFLYGEFVLGNETLTDENDVVSMGRTSARGMNYITILNFGDAEQTVDVTYAPLKAPKGDKGCSVVAMTSNLYSRNVWGVRESINAAEVKLMAREGVIIKYRT